MRPPLDEIPPHMVQIGPHKNQIRRIVHGHAIHLPDDLLTRLRIGHELLLLEELVQLGQGMPLVPAAAVGDEQLAEAVNGVVEIDGGTRRRQQIVAGHLVAAHLRHELFLRSCCTICAFSHVSLTFEAHWSLILLQSILPLSFSYAASSSLAWARRLAMSGP